MMPKILIIDDSLPNRELLGEILKGIGICDFAECGRSAVSAYNRSLRQKDFYDVILLDIDLPGVNGLQLLKKIRESEQVAGIALGDGVPIIMVTAYDQRFLEAFEIGCNDYVVKPIDSDMLIKKVKKHLPQ